MKLHALLGQHLLNEPEVSAGLAFNEAQRKEFGLRAMLPPCVTNMELNLTRIRRQLDCIENPLDKYIFLMALQVRSWQLYNINFALRSAFDGNAMMRRYG